MKMSICLLLFLLFRFTAQQQINCDENKMSAVYSATRCCLVTLPRQDPEFVSCHKKFTKMSDRPESKLKSKERIAINICAHECSFKEKGFFRAKYKGEFDTDIIDDYYLSQYSGKPILSFYMTDTFSKCIKFDSLGEVNIKYPKVSFLPNACDPQAARIMMCIRTKAMQNCPISAWNGDSYNCLSARIYFKECVGSVEKVVRTIN